MGGGQKKKSERKKGPEKKGEAVEKGILGVSPPSMDEIKDFLKGVKVITPSAFAERFKVRVSVAKYFLRDLALKGLLREVVGTNRIRIYEPLVAVQAPIAQKAGEAEAKPKRAKPSKQTASATQP